MRYHNTFGQKYKYSLDKFTKTLFLQWEYMSLKHNIIRALGLYQTSTLKNFFKIVLGRYSLSSESWDATAMAFISAQYVLTRARAICAPSMHADLFIALMRGTTSRNCCTKLK